MSAGEFGMFAFDIDGDAAPGFNGDSLVFAGITEMTVDGGPHLHGEVDRSQRHSRHRKARL